MGIAMASRPHVQVHSDREEKQRAELPNSAISFFFSSSLSFSF
jgi:hypothetical protein